MKISYCVSVCNEHVELDLLLHQLYVNLNNVDEVIILMDSEKVTEEVIKVYDSWKEEFKEQIKCTQRSLQNNFAEFKNTFLEQASGDWIVQIDADELLQEKFYENIHSILDHNSEIDLYFLPRINQVDGITQQDIDTWGWKVDDKNRINYPDHQARIFRNNGIIKWEGHVHERIIGYNNYSFFPWSDNESFCILHYKNIDRQRQQNRFYQSL